MQSPHWPAISLTQAQTLLTGAGAPFEMLNTTIRGVPTRVWKNVPPTLREVFLVGRKYGGKIFLVYEDERVSYDAFGRAVLKLANEFLSSGVEKGDRIAIAMRNVPEFPVAFFAAVLCGAIATPLNAWLTGPELARGLAYSRARILVADEERLTRIQPNLADCTALERIYSCRTGAARPQRNVISLRDIIGAAATWGDLPEHPMPAVELLPDDDATIFFTSGTTGEPRGAIGTHRNSTCTIAGLGFSRARTFLRRGEPLPRPDPNAPQRAMLVGVPLFHTTGSQALLVCALQFGVKLVLMHKWDAARALTLIEKEQCTDLGVVPTMVWQLLAAAPSGERALATLGSLSWGGAAAPPELQRRMKEHAPNAQLAVGWGMTETSSLCIHHIGEDYLARPSSCGLPLPVCDLRIVGANGEDLPVGEVGELWVRGPNVVRGYWDDPQGTEQTFRDGWLRTGDLARLDAEGFCYIVDRIKQMLIRGGENIYCAEVENVLCEHPAVRDAALVGIPDEVLGELPAAAVAIDDLDSVSEEELRAFTAARLAAFKVPVRIARLRGGLPRNELGKLNRRALEHLFTA